MSSLAALQDFLAQKRLAVVGVSREPKDFSRSLFRELRARGYDAVPVNPEADEIEGQPCFASLRGIQPPVDSVLLMTSPAATDTVVRDCADLGIKRVWMYRAGGTGAVSPIAVEFCKTRGISVVPGECPFMFLAGGAWFHRLHGFIRKITRCYPQ
jgi:predicted CoA-binding protein